uniref:Uncharacterized protein n=1 Tax=Arundo donax TaxID=35708 RepID=A0A0A9AFD3_ARUDO
MSTLQLKPLTSDEMPHIQCPLYAQ